MANHNREIMEIVQRLHKQGWRSRLGNHILLFPADPTKKPVTIALTPTDARWRATMLTKLRRAGAQL